MTLKEWVKQGRRAQRIHELSIALGCTRQFVYGVLHGKYNLTPKNTSIVCKVTGLSLREVNPKLADDLGAN